MAGYGYRDRGGAAYTVQVRGLDAMRRALRLLAPEFAKALQQANKEVAVRIVAPVAAREAPVGPTGRTARSVRGLATQKAARIRSGNARMPYIAPIYWGWPRRNIAPNKYHERAARATQGQVQAEYEAAVTRALDRVGFR